MSKKAGLQFVDFVVYRTVIARGAKEAITPFDFNIIPSGLIDSKKKVFQLALDFNLSDKDDQLLIQVESVGIFTYVGNLEDIKPFLLLNAPAIMFPFLRSYISGVTALSGLDTITIPTLNLSHLKVELEQNISTITEEKKLH